ncbi:PAS domain S-box protein [Chondromyces apiculatus]|uniref:RsbR, positive regulator of sigma-B n=1 Tax=Chondromyces apiculatus DSM 436 TaxID=1192034 RepID=A0A017T356_9BACT|nr:PAS domain S-box protein [Chondromyces apiculatus]EYF03427.1 RsbR, positive regulator of sigma-B [Chondromyces apiculatus DSM 436]
MDAPSQLDAPVAQLRERLRRLATLTAHAPGSAEVAEALDALDALEAGLSRQRSAPFETSYLNNILSSMSDLLILAGLDGIIRIANPAARKLTGRGPEDLVGQRLSLIFPDLSPPDFGDILGRDGVHDEERVCVTRSGEVLPASLSATVVRDATGRPEALLCVARDLSESKRIEEERHQLYEAVQRQEILLEELSTPLLPIADGVLVAPLVGPVDALRAARLTEALLQDVITRHARVAIVDLTGVREIAAETVAGLMRAVQAVRLLGARAVLTGLRPEVARSLIELGADLSGVPTFGTLQAGIAHAVR